MSLLIPTNKPWVLVGAGGHARVVLDMLQLAGADVRGIVDRAKPTDLAWELAWLGDDSYLETDAAHDYHFAVTFVGLRSLVNRQRVSNLLQQRRLSLPAIAHPAAVLSPSARLAAGVQVMATAVINAHATLGVAVVVNTAAVVEHDAQIANNCHIAPGAIVCGGALLGAGTIIGPGAVVAAGIQIGPNVVIGAGAIVVHDIREPGTYYGQPRPQRKIIGCKRIGVKT